MQLRWKPRWTVLIYFTADTDEVRQERLHAARTLARPYIGVGSPVVELTEAERYGPEYERLIGPTLDEHPGPDRVLVLPNLRHDAGLGDPTGPYPRAYERWQATGGGLLVTPVAVYEYEKGKQTDDDRIIESLHIIGCERAEQERVEAALRRMRRQ